MTGLFVETATATNIGLRLGNYTEHYAGQFTYDGTTVSGGVITTFAAFNWDAHFPTVFAGSSLSVPAAPYAAALLSGDTDGAIQLMFAGNDTISGSSAADFIRGLDGNDTIDGAGGDDDVNGNKGDDSVAGGAGADWVRGGQGNDTVWGGDGDDPHVNGNLGDDSVSGGAGNDTVYGGQGNDTLYGDAGDDLLSGDLGSDVLVGGAGADRYRIAAGGGFDWAAFVASDGDRILLAPGTAYTVTEISGQVVIDIGGGAQLGLAGVAAGSFSTDWIVYG